MQHCVLTAGSKIWMSRHNGACKDLAEVLPDSVGKPALIKRADGNLTIEPWERCSLSNAHWSVEDAVSSTDLRNSYVAKFRDVDCRAKHYCSNVILREIGHEVTNRLITHAELTPTLSPEGRGG
jgi:hypothetical protein